MDQTERQATWVGEQTHGTRKLNGQSDLSNPVRIYPALWPIII